MAISLEQFQQQLLSCGVLAEEELNQLLARLRADQKLESAEQLARLLVKQKLLTAYQAQQAYAGKAKTLLMGNYLILDKLGQGGMGMVLKAEHRRMKRVVALKVLSPNVQKDADAARRFQREVQAAAKLDHPNIVTAFDADDAGGTHFLVMQYVEGTDLAALVKEKGPLSVERALPCILQAARGLEYAHQRGVIHRDIKPANLLLDAQGTVKILDMGLARLDSAGGTQDQLTGTGEIMGTVDFMSPEQAMDTKTADARADIYSLGITLWYLLTGKAAYEADSLMKRLMMHLNSPIPSLCAVCPQVSPELDAVFNKMVAKTVEARYQSMTEVIASLERCSNRSATLPSVSSGPSEDSRLSAFLHGMEATASGKTTSGKIASGKAAAKNATKVESPAVATAAETTEGFQSFAVDTDPDLQPAAPSRRTRTRIQKKTAQVWWQGRIGMTAIGGSVLALLVLCGIFFSMPERDGTIRVDIRDPQVEIGIKGTDIVLKAANKGDEIALPPGEKALFVRRGQVHFETKGFMLNSAETATIDARILAGWLEIKVNQTLVGRARPSSADDATATETENQPNADNVTEPKGKPLFDGQTLAGWRGLTSDALPPGWKVMEGAIVTPGSATSIATVDLYSDFELDFEWKVAPGANGGIFYGWQGKTRNTYPAAPEYQIVDNVLHPNGRNPKTAAASIYGMYAPTEDASKPAGEWNQGRIVVRGAEIEHWLNGKKVLSCTKGSPDWRQRATQAGPLGSDAEFSEVGPGRIVLQSNTSEVQYCNIRLKSPSR